MAGTFLVCATCVFTLLIMGFNSTSVRSISCAPAALAVNKNIKKKIKKIAVRSDLRSNSMWG